MAFVFDRDVLHDVPAVAILPSMPLDRALGRIATGRAVVQLHKGPPMIAAVSVDVSTSSRPAEPTRKKWHFAAVPDLNRETKHRITRASAWPTFVGICLMLRQEGRKGRTATIRKAAIENEQISVGLRHLARDIGLNVSTVRRHVSHLVDIGLIWVYHPNVDFHVDPANGRIVTKAKGRCQNARVYLTIQAHHLRPAKAASMGADVAHQAAGQPLCKAQSAPTVRDSKNQRTPDGLAAGAGQPPAVQAGRLAAAGTGGHSAAKAGQEGPHIVPFDAGRDEPPDLPQRLSRASTRTPGRTNKYQEDQRVPVAWTGKDADAFAATRRRLDAERAAREAADTSPPVFGQGTPTFVQEAKRLEGRPADELAAELRQAALKATRKQRRKAAKAADPVPASDPDLKALLEAVEKKRKAMQTDEQAVDQERYRDAYRRETYVTT
jgi:hypothetical protein